MRACCSSPLPKGEFRLCSAWHGMAWQCRHGACCLGRSGAQTHSGFLLLVLLALITTTMIVMDGLGPGSDGSPNCPHLSDGAPPSQVAVLGSMSRTPPWITARQRPVQRQRRDCHTMEHARPAHHPRLDIRATSGTSSREVGAGCWSKQASRLRSRR